MTHASSFYDLFQCDLKGKLLHLMALNEEKSVIIHGCKHQENSRGAAVPHTVAAVPSTSQGWHSATMGHPAWGCAGQLIAATCNQSHQQLSLLFSFLLASTFGDRGDR